MNKRKFLLAVLFFLILGNIYYCDNEKYVLSYAYTEGLHLRYNFTYESDSETNLQKLFEGLDTTKIQKPSTPITSQRIRVYADGYLDIYVVEKSAFETILLYRFDQTVLKYENNGSLTSLTQAEKDLNRSVFASIGESGVFTSLWFEPNVNDLSRNFTLSMLSLTQFTLPTEDSVNPQVWESEEEDMSGTYRAQYNRIGIQKDLLKESYQFKKQKLKYVESTSTSSNQIQTDIIPSGYLIAHFNSKDGVVNSIEGTEEQIIQMAKKNVASNKTNIQFTLISNVITDKSSRKEYSNLWRHRNDSLTSISFALESSKEENERIIQRQELGKDNLATLLEKLNKSESSNEAFDVSHYLKFEALVYMQPSVSDTLADLVINTNYTARTGIFLNALAKVGHEPAQRALLKVLHRKIMDQEVANQVIYLIGNLSKPSNTTVSAIIRVAEDPNMSVLHPTALLSLGSMAQKLKTKDGKLAQMIVYWLIDQLNQSSSAKYQKLYLAALGNSQMKEILPTLEQFISNSNRAALQEEAILSLRLVDSERAEKLLFALLYDLEPNKRESAIHALSFRKPSTNILNALIGAYSKETYEDNRLQLMYNIWDLYDNYPEDVTSFMKQITKNDASQNIRKEAERRIKN